MLTCLPVPSKSLFLGGCSPWTVSCAAEVCCPTLKLIGPQSSSVTFLRIKVWRVPWTLISFISLDCRGTSPRNHCASWVVSRDSLHSNTASSPSYKVTSFSVSTMAAAGSLWKGQQNLISTFKWCLLGKTFLYALSWQYHIIWKNNHKALTIKCMEM